jgi:hypothetical protein
LCKACHDTKTAKEAVKAQRMNSHA